MSHKYLTQIYEIASSDEAVALANLGVDNIGSVLLSQDDWKQPRIKETIAAAQMAGAKSVLIPLFSHHDTILRVIDDYQPNIIHFCETLVGSDDAEIKKLIALQQKIKSRFGNIQIMRSIPIAATGLANTVPTLALAQHFEETSDYFLTDTYLTKTNFVGITGKTCDWDMAAQLVRTSKIPVFLAGGISPENTYDALVHTRPFGIDSCTLTNQVDENGKPIRFKKDLDKVARLVSEVRRAERAK